MEMLQIIPWSRQVMLTDAFSQAPQKKIVLAFVHLFAVHFSFVVLSNSVHFLHICSYLSSYTVCFISNRVIPLVFHLWCIMQSDWTQSPKELSAIIFGLYTNACSSDRRWIIFLPIFGIALLVIECVQMVGKASKHFIKYYIFSCGALLCIEPHLVFEGSSCRNNSRLSLC